MKAAKRVLCLLLCLFLTPLYALAAEENAPAPNVRVLLRRLGLTDRADLTLDGVYTVEGEKELQMIFPRGSQITIQIRQGVLYLYYAGMNLRAGKALTLTRHAVAEGDAGGLRFEKGGNLYPGSLALTINDGILRPILTISVEDYLLGVVPYEMSESFPLEALKAQAVCARTYALSRISTSRDYDVVDTTNDQVFRGVNATHTRTAQAVRETAGVVGTYRDRLATCYYSASNGGQTELVENVWSGRGDWSYYAMTDDPYDLENPESLVRTARLSKRGSLPDALTAAVYKAAAAQIRAQGYLAGEEHFRVDGVEAVQLLTPRFASPSRMMTELALTVSWSGRKVGDKAPAPSPTPEEELYLFSTPVPTPTPTASPTALVSPTPTPDVTVPFTPAQSPLTVTLPLYPELIRALNLSISGTDNELVTVVETDTHFLLQSRRFGHGVGMSQRGAQWMAGQYGKKFHEILAFYYPGMTLMQAQSGRPALATVPPVLAQTPGPAATPTPRPTLMPVTETNLPAGAYLATVMGIDDDSSLNLRAEPTQASEILRRLYKYQRLIVLEACEDPAWVRVRTDAMEGYVMVSFLQRDGEASSTSTQNP